jgi:hypothetical protein
MFFIIMVPDSREDRQMQQSTSNTYDRLRQRAYELWEQHGRPEGYDKEFWSQAERELQVEGSDAETSMAISANASSAKSGSGSDGPGGN